jgi:hypothetical protein
VLAVSGGISPVSLSSEIETRKKPGSAIVTVTPSKVLGIDAADLLPEVG